MKLTKGGEEKDSGNIIEMTDDEKICTINQIMKFMCSAFNATDIVVLTLDTKHQERYRAGIHTYCHDEETIGNILIKATDAFFTAMNSRKEKE